MRTASFGVLLMLAALVAGCGDFWENPGGTGTGTGTQTSSIALSAQPTSATVSTNVVLTATVTPTAATGTVSFLNNGAQIGTGTVSSGTATYTATFATAGTESLTATYSGDSTYASSTSSAVSVTVTAATATSTIADAFPASMSRATNLVLDPAGIFSFNANSSLHDLSGVALSGGAVENIDSGGHCLYYTGRLYLSGGKSDAKGVYPLNGGGYLAPAGTAGLDCD